MTHRFGRAGRKYAQTARQAGANYSICDDDACVAFAATGYECGDDDACVGPGGAGAPGRTYTGDDDACMNFGKGKRYGRASGRRNRR